MRIIQKFSRVSLVVSLSCLLLSAVSLFAQEHPFNLLMKASPNEENLAWRRFPVEGFAWPTSVLPGDTIRFYVSTMPRNNDSTFDIDIFRVPNIDIEDSNLTGSTLHNRQGRFFPLRDSLLEPIYPGDASRLPKDFKLGCKDYWATGAIAFVVPSNWQSGLYGARLKHHQTAQYDSLSFYMPFIVRSPSPGTTTKILFKFDLNTWQAYNWWGGSSLYSDQDPTFVKTDTIAFDRPVQIIIGQSLRYAYGPFFSMLQDSGYTMDFCDNIDLDRNANLLSDYQMLIIWGHDEYWSERERSITESFKGDAIQGFPSGLHGNIARFAPNTCYWRVHWEGGSDGTHQRLWCQKDNGPSGIMLDKWRYSGPGGANNPEAKFLGSQYQTGWNSVYADTAHIAEEPPDVVHKADHWIFQGTQLAVGDTFGYGVVTPFGVRTGIVSGELDNLITARADFPTDTLAQRLVLSRIDTCASPPCYGYVLHQMVYYEDTVSNARVFAQGAGNWWLGLHPYGDHPDDIQRMKRITMNIMDHFSGKKYLGKVWTHGPLNALEWTSSVELDGDVDVPDGRYLKVISTSVTIDSGVTLNISGTLEINGSVTITGSGKVHIGTTGNILLASGATLKIKTTVQTADSVIISVPSATTLRIDTLGKMYFSIGSRINVSGTFVAQGTAANPVLLTRSNANNDYWSGITLNAFASATLNHCNILHAQVGISANSVEPTISHCTFDSCKIGVSLFQSAGTITNSLFTHNIIKGVIIDGEYDFIEPSAVPLLTDNVVSSNTTGIYITNSAPILERDTIEDNAQYGIACVNNGNAFVSRNEIDAPGYNVLNNNGTANLFVDNSSPFIGYADERIDGIYGGYNSFGPEKHEYDVWAQNESAVIARKNYWSEYPPDEESSFHIAGYGFSTIDWGLPLEYFGYRPTSAPYTITKTQQGQPSLLRGGIANSTLLAALNLRSQKKYAQAVSLMKQFIRESATNDLAPAVFIVLQQTLADYARFNRNPSLRTAFAGYRDSLIAGTESDRLKRVLLNSTKDDLMQRKMWNQAIAVAEVISNQYPNTRLDEQALYTTVTANLFGLGNGQDAEQQYALMQQRFPESELTAVARLLLEGMANRAAATSPAVNKGLTMVGEVELRPSHFALHQNYPNPFNPSTTIRYDLPEPSRVSLVVYDVLGRKVAELENGVKEAGYHSATWNASNMSSGIYFYRIQAEQFAQTKKLIMLR